MYYGGGSKSLKNKKVLREMNYSFLLFAVDSYTMNWGTLNEPGDIISREESCLVSGCRNFLVEAFSISSIITSVSSYLVEISNHHLHLQCTRPFLFI
ncbi:hypothetical protein PanWU01x14_368560 [Parasponia andersonii]|uniref:Uncharacterized protein n=1 Tax=Parasponia andersonii TaxID=3476 RepID=A0A2P5A512_PARAD|nr:hypothetical protein PanWU01x14_368560 [Parasponia andersonii]